VTDPATRARTTFAKGDLLTSCSGVTRRLAGLTALTSVLLCLGIGIASGAAEPERRIVPGQSIGFAKLGMTRAAIEAKLKSPEAPKRTQAEGRYSLSYRYPYRSGGNSGNALMIVFKGLGRQSPAGYMVTTERTLGTQPDDIGVGDRFYKLVASFPNANCYHSETDGSRSDEIEDSENFECEVRSNGNFTYFSFASLDADPGQHIGAIAVSSIKID
jgi:hypothetical protein